MAPLSKWIDGLNADGSVGDAARKSLEARLATVAYWLPLAARPVNGDLERVHQLRVATRRAVAALKLYRDSLPGKPRRWLTKRLKKIRHTSGEARDLDVLFARLQKNFGDERSEVLQCLADQRASLQPKILAIADRCHADNRLHRETYALLNGIVAVEVAAAADNSIFRSWASAKLHHVAERFFAAEPSDNADWSALHQFRIAGKKLRYTIELLSPAFGSELRRDLYPIVQELQEKLGNINDFVVGAALLEKLGESINSPPAKGLCDQLIAEHGTSRDQAIADFREWWTPERASALRDGLAPAVRPEPSG
jgi:CHAD domain-containing protein